MTTTPLPPLPYTEHGLCFFDEGGAQPCDGDGYTTAQVQAYALAARADLEAELKVIDDMNAQLREQNTSLDAECARLEAENARLREALQFAVDEQFGDVPARYPLSQWIVDAQKVLEGRK